MAGTAAAGAAEVGPGGREAGRPGGREAGGREGRAGQHDDHAPLGVQDVSKKCFRVSVGGAWGQGS